MLRDVLRAVGHEPRPPNAPSRVWRDHVLLAAGLCGVVLEATLRDHIVWRPATAALAAWLCVLTWWRRSRPLSMVVLGFGALAVLQLATLVAGPPRPVE